jgi:hypothetical protein
MGFKVEIDKAECIAGEKVTAFDHAADFNADVICRFG